MQRQKTAASLRLPQPMLSQLRQLAHKRSLATGKETRWTGLVLEALDRFLEENESAPKKGGRP